MSGSKSAKILGGRIRQIRVERFGPNGLVELEQLSGISERTWMNYESGVTIPGLTLLKFIDLTAVAPLWLLYGNGPMYRDDRRY